jgi:peptidylprolyl isomerase
MNKKKLKVSLSLLAIAGILSAIPVASYASQKNASKNEAKVEPKHEEAAPVKEEELALDIPKISESFGHLIGKNLDSLGFKFDMDKIIKGMQDSVLGKEPPMSESECIQAISQDQEKKFKKVAQQNLNDAEKFLESNSSKDGIVSIEEKKLQYKIEKEGSGEVVQAHYSPLIKYTGKFLDGKVFGASKEDEMISLDETIPGFSKGIVGMKEGEKRTLYIHPDLAYGVNGSLPPNSLLTFEIEIVKANNPQDQEAVISSNTNELEEDQELALDEEEKEEVK